jgi:regulator of protease activity HflC (stomatin/prohibitin superfamily)
MDGVLVNLIVLVIVVAAIAVGVRLSVGRATVHDYERGLRYVRGRFRGLLEAGDYVYFRLTTEIRVLDARPTWLLVEGQEVPTADGVPVKVSLGARYVVGDAVTVVTADQDAKRALYLELQLALRESIATRTVDEALAARTAIGAELLERCTADATALGLELIAVAVRDVMVPGELKRAYASVIAARKDGEAALERARGETAALRSLANSARLLEDNPGLLRLRAIQQIGQTGGNTIMLGLDGGPPPPPDARVAARPRRTPPVTGDVSVDDR